MATLSSSTPSIQRDIRSESRSYKRDKDHNSKWAMGSRPSGGVRQIGYYEPTYTGSTEQKAKVRPEKRVSEYGSIWGIRSGAETRMARKRDALKEVTSGSSLSRSLSDLLPSPSGASRTPSVDAGVLYSFDAPSTPREVVGLNTLVEKAEMEWQSRETDKIVREEYEILDQIGEVKVITKGKGKKGSPRQRAQVVVVEDEDDWETI